MRVLSIAIGCAIWLLAACEWKQEDHGVVLVKKKRLIFPFEKHTGKTSGANPDTSYLNFLFRSKGLVDISELENRILVNLRYADTSNFLHTAFYDGLRTAYLNCETAIKLSNAQYFLSEIDSNLVLMILDASRPLHIQQMMWDSLDMPPIKKYQYLSPPSEPSLHNYGCAVDVTLVDRVLGTELDMGSGYDEFVKLSEPAMEKHFLKNGELSEEAYANRLLLRKVMERAGFKPITTEWWHFSICTKPEAQKRFELIN